MKYLFPILRWFGLRKVNYTTEVLGYPESRSERVYYLWVFGSKWKKLMARHRPMVLTGTIKSVTQQTVACKPNS